MTETAEIEQKALDIGWVPKERFRGYADAWVDAETYLKRGETFVPFLKAQKRELEHQLAARDAKLSTLEHTLSEATETIEALKEFRTELNKERVEERKEQLVEGIKAAREEGNVEKEEALREKLSEAKEALKPPRSEPKPNGAPASPLAGIENSPAWVGFLAANPWWTEDMVMRASAVAIGMDLASKGKLDNLTQEQRLAAIARDTRERFGMNEQPRTSQVEGGRGGAGRRQETSSDEKSYADLSAEAKAACGKFEPRLVGKKAGQYATVEEYRKHYAAEFWKRNPDG